jgi:hypothetical protein
VLHLTEIKGCGYNEKYLGVCGFVARENKENNKQNNSVVYLRLYYILNIRSLLHIPTFQTSAAARASSCGLMPDITRRRKVVDKNSDFACSFSTYAGCRLRTSSATPKISCLDA